MVQVVDQVEQKGKRKRFNKNRKKAWRKRANIDEVEEKLVEERREERFGGSLEEREDSDLLFLDCGNASSEQTKDGECVLGFTVDTVPEESSSRTKVKVGSKARRKQKTLSCHKFINGLQGAKAPHKPQPKQSQVSAKLKKKVILRAKDPKVAKKYKKIVKQIEENEKKAEPKVIFRRNFDSDVWNKDADDVTQECKKKGLEESFIKGISDYYRIQRKQRPVKVPNCRYVEVSKLSAVQVPKAGTSYNPAYDDHQELMQEAVSQEEKRRKINESIERATTKLFPTIDEAPTESKWLEEMSQGLPKVGDNVEEESGGVDNKDQVTVTSKPKNEKKTKKQRKKEWKQKVTKLKRLQEKQNRSRSSDVFRVKTFIKEIDEAEKLTKKRIIGRIAQKEQKKSQTHRLGKLKFEEEDIPVKLGDELPNCLRRIRPAGNPIEERFKNLQSRNLIEPRLPHKMQRKFKLKKTMKRTYKTEFEKIQQVADSL